jgi:2-polyprenyl-6-methoxyphenol hydroxylase-like FAD-dependent oxidoreductase
LIERFDIATVGGGLGGAAIAKAMAERGARVLVLERDTSFRDRVRGEALSAWGTAEAKKLGLYDALAERCGHMLRYWSIYAGGHQIVKRDLFATTPQGDGWFTFYHPRMQEIALELAVAAGAHVRRGARVRGVTPGPTPRVAVEERGRTYEVDARLVVGADGRASMVRQWGGFTATNDPAKLLFSGVLFDRVASPADEFYHALAPGLGLTALIFPQRDGQARTYFGFHKDAGLERLQGAGDVTRYRALSHRIGVPVEFYAEAKPIGPLSTFDGADSWVAHPYRDGVALIGDAASTSDPTWGQGMSLTLRDARVLRDALLAEADWDKAGNAYAREHDRYYEIVHRADGWYRDVFMEIGPEADERRSRALPLLVQDPSRILDVGMSGPEAPHDDASRRRFFGET